MLYLQITDKDWTSKRGFNDLAHLSSDRLIQRMKPE